MTRLNLSTRAYDRTRNEKLARTIADLAECEEIQLIHLAEELHAPQSTEIDAQHCVLSQVLIHLNRKQYKGNLQSLREGRTYIDPRKRNGVHRPIPVTRGIDLPHATCPIDHEIDFFSKRLILIYKLQFVFMILINNGRELACFKRASTPFIGSVTFCSTL
jgi:hypothetical protein